jgi:hypothetical protein
MNKHTPGPWSTDEKEHDEPYQDIRIRSCFRGICRVWIDDAPCHDYNAEQRANARLIAAAPELLAALQGLLRGIFDGPDEADAAMLVAKARDAVNKATGGEK